MYGELEIAETLLIFLPLSDIAEYMSEPSLLKCHVCRAKTLEFSRRGRDFFPTVSVDRRDHPVLFHT